MIRIYCSYFVFFFQAEDGIRDAQESRGLGDVYKRQVVNRWENARLWRNSSAQSGNWIELKLAQDGPNRLSLIHI